MTSDEIKAWHSKLDLAPEGFWLQEIAYQLAAMNEREASGDQQAINEMLKKVGLGSPVGADSETEVRGGRPLTDAQLLDNAHELAIWASHATGLPHEFETALESFLDAYDHTHSASDERTTRPDPQSASLQKP